MKRRDFLRAGAAGAAIVRVAPALAPPSTGTRAVPIEEAPIAALQAAMADGALSARELTGWYLDRIAAMDRQGPALHAVIETNPDAIAIAELLDRERSEGRTRGPLHGIPILLKDNVDTADRMTTTAGSLALEGSVAPRDAFIAERLRAAGAILIGKANLSEWANFRSTRSTSGWSGRGGQCRNPYALDRTPCGSSSGSGAATAASFCAAAIGTETDGSILCPSAAQSLVGIKPTLGLVSRSGIIPIAHSQDTAGPMARTVADARDLLAAIAAPDPRDTPTRAAGRNAVDLARPLDAGALRGARLGVLRRHFGENPWADAVAENAIAALRSAGATIVDPVKIPTAGQWGDAEFEVLLYEFKADLDAYLAALGASAPVRSLADVILFNERHKERSMPYFGQEIMLMAAKKGPLTDAAYRTARTRARRLAGAKGIDAALAAQRLDALVAPTGGPPWPIDFVNGDHGGGASYGAAAVAGYPSVTVPMGYVFGLPLGLSFYGPAWSDARLIGYAHAFEQATNARRPPRYLASAEPAG